MIDYSILKSFLLNHQEFSSLIEEGAIQGIANILNDLNGVGSGNITLTQLDKNTFLKVTAIVAIRLGIGIGYDNQTTLTPLVIAKWKAALDQAKAADPGSYIDLSIINALGNPIQDMVISSSELTFLTNKIGSGSEVLFGLGTILSCNDISNALSI